MNDDSNLENVDWSKTTFEGSERENLRGWRRLTFDQKLQAVEELEALGMEFIDRRKARGLPYIDPETGKLMAGTKVEVPGQVAETPTAYRESQSRAHPDLKDQGPDLGSKR